MDPSRKKKGAELISQNQKRRQSNIASSRQNRTWTKEEEQVLVDGLVDLVHSGGWKADNGTFRSGYLNQLEKYMNEKMPGCGLLARPHIEGHVKQLKNAYRVIDQLKGVENGGFEWNDDQKCILADQNVFDEWVKSHPQAKGWNRRPFPFYDSFAIVYGKDYASGGGAEDMANAIHNVDVEEEDNQIYSPVVDSIANMNTRADQASPCVDESMQSSPRLVGNAIDTPPQASQHGGGFSRSKRQKLESSIHSQLDRLGTLFEASLNKFSELIDCLSVEKDIHNKRARVEAELAKIEELTDVDRIKVGRKLVQDPADLQFFFSLSDYMRKTYVFTLISDT